MINNISKVHEKLDFMEQRGIWPNGLRYLWTDAFGIVLLVSLYKFLGKQHYLDKARQLVSNVDAVLGRPVGLRIGEEPDRDGQYFHYLTKWMYALGCLGQFDSSYLEKAIALAKAIHPRFLIPGVGVVWKMKEDLSSPYPGYGLGSLDAFDGYVVYSFLSRDELHDEISDMRTIVNRSFRDIRIDQDLGIGMMLWMTHLQPDENWAIHQRARCLDSLNHLWIDPPGYFCRGRGQNTTRFAFTNYGISVGLQAVDSFSSRVGRLNEYFDSYRSGDEYDSNAITHVMACSSYFPGMFIRNQHIDHRKEVAPCV